jgi:small nuclear ribonucleoprotein G
MSKAHPLKPKKKKNYAEEIIEIKWWQTDLRNIFGFDPFMNLMIDECVEMATSEQNNMGMLVMWENSIIVRSLGKSLNNGCSAEIHAPFSKGPVLLWSKYWVMHIFIMNFCNSQKISSLWTLSYKLDMGRGDKKKSTPLSCNSLKYYIFKTTTPPT